MNKGAAICLTALLLLLPMTACGEGEQGRIPPAVQKYQDAQRVEELSPERLSVYTNDSFDKVVDFYRRTLAMEPVDEGRFLVGHSVANLNRPSHGDYTLWLNVSSSDSCVRLDDSELFGFLNAEVAAKRIHSAEELRQVKEKYAHLKQAWYPGFDVKAKLESCSNSARAGVVEAQNKEPARDKAQENEMFARMQEMMAQGRYQEAKEMAMQSARPGMETGRAMQQENETDHWNEGVACLEEIDKHDFRTRIDIDLLLGQFKASTIAERQEAADEVAAERNRQDSQDEGEIKSQASPTTNRTVDDLKGRFGL